ncbi:glycosyltransferase [Alkalicoccobacillus gibsonii]|uniref:glycosyltransferase n=1 Tax=Alkalicoccobacillus gibsonii TaxID=79881 RepID=UPI0035131B79
MMNSSVLIIHHNGGGGVSQFISQWKNEHKDVTIYEAFVEHQTVIFRLEGSLDWHVSFSDLKRQITQLKIGHIHIHHLWQMELPTLSAVLTDLQIPYTCWIHDFYALCPFVFFVNQKGTYCGRPKQERVCDACATRGARRVHMEQMLASRVPSIKKWRAIFTNLLKEADQVIAPSDSAKIIIHEYVPDLKIDVFPHPLSFSIKQNPLKEPQAPVRIALLGNLAYHKGDQEVRTLLNQTHRLQQPCEFYHYGALSRTLDKLSFPHFYKRGSYSSPEKLPHLLKEDRIDFVIIPSVCPETFSYTTHEAIAMGYPVLCFDLGAQAEVVNRLGAGWTVSINTPHSLFSKVTELVNDPWKIYRKRKETLPLMKESLDRSD